MSGSVSPVATLSADIVGHQNDGRHWRPTMSGSVSPVATFSANIVGHQNDGRHCRTTIMTGRMWRAISVNAGLHERPKNG